MTTRRWGVLALALAIGLALGVQSTDARRQTGILMPMPRAYFTDAAGAACAGCQLFSYVAGTTTKLATYTDAALSVANTNPVVLDSAGRAVVYLNPTLSYKFVLAPPTDTDPPSAAYWTQDNVIGPYSGVVTISAASTRGLVVTRSGAEAGIAITSSGGSGKTYGIASLTTGEFRIQDDADSTPRFSMLGNDVTTTLTGTYTISGGLLSVTGFGAHSLSGSGTGTQTLTIRNTTNGATNGAEVSVGNDSAANAGRILHTASGYTPSSPFLANSFNVFGTQAGGLSVGTIGAFPLRFYSNSVARGQVTSAGRLLWDSGYATSGLSTTTGLEIGAQGGTDRVQMIFGDGSGYNWSVGHPSAGAYVKDFSVDDRGYVLAPRQPYFLAINSATDTNVLTGATVDFDTELTDIGGNFAADQFTAPVAGTYLFCAGVTYSDNASSTFTASINVAGALYRIGSDLVTTAGAVSGCVMVAMSAGNGALVSVETTDTAVDIEGSASPRVTWFTGRLVQ